MKKNKFVFYEGSPIHYPNGWLALCGSGWLQASGIESDVTCPECLRLLTQRAPDLANAPEIQRLCANCHQYHSVAVACTPSG